MLQRHLKRLLRIALIRVVDDVARAFFQRECETEDHLLRHACCPRELLQRFHPTHYLLGCGAQFDFHARGSVPTASFTLNVRIAMSSDCGAVPTKTRTFASKP